MSVPTTARASERAQVALRDAILRGELAAGAHLGEVELAERLGVSRTPVREALARLAAEGLVEVHAHRGARVVSFAPEDLHGLFDVRLALEPRATGRAATRATTDDLAALDDLAHRMLEVGAPGPRQDLDALVPLNRDFHARLLAVADAPALAAALAGVVHAPVVLRTFHAYDPASLARSLAHHVEIVAALRVGDADWASAVMRCHLGNARAVMVGGAAMTAHGTAFSGRVGWGARPALVVVDLVRAYVEPGGPFFLDGAQDRVLAATADLLAAARAGGVPVVWTVVRYAADLADAGFFAAKVPALRCFADGAEGGWGELALAPRPEEALLAKQHASAFAGTSLAATLRARGVDTVVVAGVSTSGCVRATATDALAAGFRPVVVAPACGDRGDALHEQNLADLDAKYADVVDLAEALTHLGPSPHGGT